MARKSKGDEIEEALNKRLDDYAQKQTTGEMPKLSLEDQEKQVSSEDTYTSSSADHVDEAEALRRLNEMRTESRTKARAKKDALDALYPNERKTHTSERNVEQERREAEAAAAAAEEDARREELLTPLGQNAHTVTPVIYGPSESVQKTFSRNSGRIRHKVAAALISILAIFGIGLGAGLYKQHVESEADTAAKIAENERLAAEAQAEQERLEAEAEEKRIEEAAHAPRDVQFIVSAADLDSRSSRIPLVITGTDADGNEVNTEGFINSEGLGLSLAPGSYTASIPASPVRADGGMYAVPTDTYSFTIPNDERTTIEVDQAIVLIPINVAELSDEVVDSAYEWGMKDAQFAGVVEENVATANRIREEEAQRKADEERNLARQQERASLAQSFAEAYFTTVGFPDEDDDSKIMAITNWTAVAGQYVASGSSAQSKLGNGPGVRYSYATRVSASGTSEDSVTVDVEAVMSDKVEVGWTRDTSNRTITCTFNNDNKITDFNVD